MNRFEIQELLNQPEWGVTYLAYDRQEGRNVTLRRYIRLGNSDGFNQSQSLEYQQRCDRLRQVAHPNLRSTVHGGVDPLDNTPYLVTEWVEGRPLSELMAGQPMAAKNAKELAKSALHVSLVLSKAFDEEAVWIDTHPDAIVVGNEESGRGYTFWVCMAAWLGDRRERRQAGSLAIMIEKLMGLDAAGYPDTSAGELGPWLKMVKNSPWISVAEALKQLEAIDGRQTKLAEPIRDKNLVVTRPPTPAAMAPPKTATAKTATARTGVPVAAPPKAGSLHSGPTRPHAPSTQSPHASPSLQPEHIRHKTQPVVLGPPAKTSKFPVGIASLGAACLIGIICLISITRNKGGDEITADHAAPAPPRAPAPRNEITRTAPEPAPAPLTFSAPEEPPQPPETPETPETPEPPPASSVQPEPAKPQTPVAETTPDPDAPINFTDHSYFMKLKGGEKIKAKGELTAIVNGPRGDIILRFAGKPEKTARAMVAIEGIPAFINIERLQPFLNKQVILEGKYLWVKKVGKFVVIDSMSNIRVAE